MDEEDKPAAEGQETRYDRHGDVAIEAGCINSSMR